LQDFEFDSVCKDALLEGSCGVVKTLVEKEYIELEELVKALWSRGIEELYREMQWSESMRKDLVNFSEAERGKEAIKYLSQKMKSST
jgi:hypothetical protein